MTSIHPVERIEAILTNSDRSVLHPFTLSSLIGQEIIGNRVVDLQRDAQEHTYPGRYAQVLDFRSGSALVWYEEGHHDYSTNHYYLMQPTGEVRYAEDLFNPPEHHRT